MKMLFFILFVAGIVAACFSKSPVAMKKTAADTCLRAVVWDTSNLACGMPVLNFAEDSVAIRALTGRQELMYVAKHLPSDVNIKGKKLCVSAALLQPEEDFYCTMIGITYPHIKVVSAKARE